MRPKETLMLSRILVKITISYCCLLLCALVFGTATPVLAQAQLPASEEQPGQNFVYLPLIETAGAPDADAPQFNFDRNIALDLRGQSTIEHILAASSKDYRLLAVSPSERQRFADPFTGDSTAGSRPVTLAQPVDMVVYLVFVEHSPAMRSLAWPACQ
jgi:hypothetical protein